MGAVHERRPGTCECWRAGAEESGHGGGRLPRGLAHAGVLPSATRVRQERQVVARSGVPLRARRRPSRVQNATSLLLDVTGNTGGFISCGLALVLGLYPMATYGDLGLRYDRILGCVSCIHKLLNVRAGSTPCTLTGSGLLTCNPALKPKTKQGGRRVRVRQRPQPRRPGRHRAHPAGRRRLCRGEGSPSNLALLAATPRCMAWACGSAACSFAV